MTTPDEQRSPEALIGSFAMRTEKVGLAVQVAVLLVLMFVLLVMEPDNRVPLYILLAGVIATTALSALRLRKRIQQGNRGSK
jgi:hypothetical protein